MSLLGSGQLRRVESRARDREERGEGSIPAHRDYSLLSLFYFLAKRVSGQWEIVDRDAWSVVRNALTVHGPRSTLKWAGREPRWLLATHWSPLAWLTRAAGNSPHRRSAPCFRSTAVVRVILSGQ